MSKLSWMTGRFPDPEVLPTPSFGLNRALNGGLYSGRVHVYWGLKASGKTTSALHQIAEAQRRGKTCAFVDAEKTYNDNWAELCGVDNENLLKVRANSAEEIAGLVCPALEKGEIKLLVVDSLSSLALSSYLDKPDNNAIGTYARASKFFTHKILNSLQHDQQVIFISHAAIAFQGSSGMPMLKSATGNAVDHWSSTIIKFNLHSGKSNVREDGARRVSWRIDKSKTSPYPIEGSYYFMQDKGRIDSIAEMAAYAIEEGLVQRGGSWIYYPDKETCGDRKWQSEAKFLATLNEDPEFFKIIEAELMANGVTTLEDEEVG